MRFSRTCVAFSAGAMLAALTAGGCAIRKPTMALRDIEVAGIGFKQVDLVLDLAVSNPNDFQINLLEVVNPNPFALPLKALNGAVKVGDRTVLRVDETTLNPVPPNEKRTVNVPVKLDSLGVLGLLREGLADRRKISFEGDLVLDAPVSLHEFLVTHLAREE